MCKLKAFIIKAFRISIHLSFRHLLPDFVQACHQAFTVYRQDSFKHSCHSIIILALFQYIFTQNIKIFCLSQFIRRHLVDVVIQEIAVEVVAVGTPLKQVPLVRGFDDIFLAPHSRHTETPTEAIRACRELTVLAESPQAGVYLAMAHRGPCHNHPVILFIPHLVKSGVKLVQVACRSVHGQDPDNIRKIEALMAELQVEVPKVEEGSQTSAS